MTRRLSDKNSDRLITEFGNFLERTKSGMEPTLDEIQQAMGESGNLA
jgi:hypothetical protein